MEPFKDKKTILDNETVKNTLSSAIKTINSSKETSKIYLGRFANFNLIFKSNPFR